MIETLLSYQARNNEQLDFAWRSRLPHQNQNLIFDRYGVAQAATRPFLVYITGDARLPLKSSTLNFCSQTLFMPTLWFDDLPAMDDDELRRGHQTCHIKFDEATAILTGDALQTLAFTILAEGVECWQESNRVPNDSTPSWSLWCSRYVLMESKCRSGKPRGYARRTGKKFTAIKRSALMKSAILLGALAAAGEKAFEVLPQLDKYADICRLAFPSSRRYHEYHWRHRNFG